MALVESYSPCPCGSGEKYKWCCQKVEAVAERSLRLQESNQLESALTALDEGFRKHPDTPWLHIRKAILLSRLGKTAEAAEPLRKLLEKNPGHVGAQNFLARIVLETQGAKAGAEQFQAALNAVKPDDLPGLAMTAQLLGVMLGEMGHIPAAMAHLMLAQSIDAEEADDSMIAQSLRMIESNPAISCWLRNPYEPMPVPDDATETVAVRFDQALEWALSGYWSMAASAFELLSGDHVAGADYNLGLCRLWMADETEAIAAFHRHLRSAGITEAAVDIEGLCQLIAPPQFDEPVEHVQLTWPIRDRVKLLERLKSDATTDYRGTGPLDPEVEGSPEAEYYALLDRPKPPSIDGLTVGQMPRVLGLALIAKDKAALDIYDDGRLNTIQSQFVEVAGPTVPPAHPRTKVIETVPRSSVVLRSEMWLPETATTEQTDSLTQQEHARIILEVWPTTRLPYLDRKTPKQVAGDPAYEVPLRAAICQFEVSQEFWRGHIDFTKLRESLKVSPEPVIDPSTCNLESLHLSRLHSVPASELTDDRLITLFERAHHYVLPMAMEKAAAALVDRTQVFESGKVDRVVVFSDLCNLSQSRGDLAESKQWLVRGRAADTRAGNAVRWDFLELKHRTRTSDPEEWVPDLALILERYRDDREASSHILTNLVEMRLVQVSPNPDSPGQMLMDTRPLQGVLARYGPKITTASGRLGVSATQGGIWTPGGATGGGSASGGGIWTPGGATPTAAGGGDKPKLIIPGR